MRLSAATPRLLSLLEPSAARHAALTCQLAELSKAISGLAGRTHLPDFVGLATDLLALHTGEPAPFGFLFVH